MWHAIGAAGAALEAPLVRPARLVLGWSALRWLDRTGTRGRSILVGVLASAAIAVIEVWFIETRVIDAVLVQSAARATDHVQLGVLSRVSAADFESPHTRERVVDLSARLRPMLAPLRNGASGIVAVNLVASDGTIIYSDLPRMAGERVGLDDEAILRDVLDGHLLGGLDGLSDPADSALKPLLDEAFEVYVPVVIDGVVVGAYEVYQDVSSFRSMRLLLWAALTVACTALLALGIGVREVFRTCVPNRNTSTHNAKALNGALLTPRELEVLALLALGDSYRDVAAHLALSEETVRSHVKRILHKTGQPNRTAAVAAALRAGLMRLP
jgi:DNA-binding CsgD family transcriptional regulator